jgi:ubiquinone/menaquinone biosynthesis C-methylase UbiE
VYNYDGPGKASYRQDFWENANRAYEDRSERVALGRLLHPPQGRRLLELGAGFGRLSEVYQGYEQVILLDYAKSQLEEARARLGDGKYLYVAADIYRLPIADGACDAAAMIRVLHHLGQAPQALAQIRAALCDGALFILEYANKRNLKALARYALGRQSWNPYALDPVEFVAHHWDFHPDYIAAQMADLGFRVKNRLSLSYFRLGLLKNTLPTGLLVGLDTALQTWAPLYSPSVFTQNYTPGQAPAALPAAIFKCTECGHSPLDESGEEVTCSHCGAAWSKAGGVYDFRQTLNRH